MIRVLLEVTKSSLELKRVSQTSNFCHSCLKLQINTNYNIILLSECKYPFGVEWGHRHDRSLVKDDQMTASSTEWGSAPHFGRLGFSSKAWCPQESLIQNQHSKMEQYLQIDFIIASKITGVSTQGSGSNVVLSYNLYYALDVNMFHCIVNEYGLCKVSNQ